MTHEQDNIVNTVNWQKEFVVDITLKVTNFTSSVPENILHLTTGANSLRVAAIWVATCNLDNEECTLQLYTQAISGFNFKVKMNKYYTFNFAQNLHSGKVDKDLF